MSEYRLTAQHYMPLFTSVHDKKNYSTIQKQNSINLLTNRRINNNALVVQVIQMT
jgi:hypothetical protein